MALTQQQLDATRKYKAGEITSDQYKQEYVTNYNPAKDPTAGKNIAYSGTSSPEATRIQEMSQAYHNSVNPQPTQPIPQVIPQMQMPAYQAPAYQQPDYSSYINGLAEQTKAKNVADLQRAYEKSIGGLNQEQSTIAPKFEQGRSDARRLAINQAKDFENFLATKGLSASGTAGQGMIQQQGQLLGSIGESKTAEGNAQADIERRRSGLGTDLQYGIQSTQAQVEIDRNRQLLEAQQLADQRAYSESLKLADRAYNEQREAQGFAREDAQTTADRTREDFINTIGGIRDYSAQINNVQNDGDPSNDWQIPFLQQSRQDKIVNQNLDPRTGKPLPVDTTPQITSSSAAIDLWKQLGTANQSIANALGIPVGTRYTAQASGSSGGSSGSTSSVAPTSTPKQIISYAESQLRGSGGSSAADKLVTLNNAGVMDNLTPSEIKSLMNKFGVDEKMIEQAENRLESLTTGVTLPSGRVTVPTNPNLLVR